MGGGGQAQHLGQLVQQLLLPGGPAPLPGQALHRIGVGHLHQAGLVPPLGLVELHLAAPLFAQGLAQGVGVGGQGVHRDDLGDLLVVQVIPGQELFPDLLQVGPVVEHELPLVGQAAVAVAQHRGADRIRRARQGHHVHLQALVHHHLLAFGHLGDGGDLVPQQGGRLKLQPLAGLLHPLGQGLEDVLFAVADQVHRPPDGLVVLLAADAAAAHPHALADVGVEAGPALAQVLGEAPAAPGQQKGVLGALGHLPGGKAGGVGADVFGAVLLFLQGERQAGPGLPRHLDVGVALVVLEQDVVFGGVGLDLAGLQHQRLELALADDDVKAEGVGDHLGDLVVVGHPLPEILADPGAQPLGLADINDLAAFVPDDIDPWQQGQHAGLLVQLRFGHRFTLLILWRAPGPRPAGANKKGRNRRPPQLLD